MKMTKELDARARAYAKKMCEQYGDEEQIWTDSYNTYIEIAAEQQKLDITKAYYWLKHHLGIGNGTLEFVNAFRKAMED